MEQQSFRPPLSVPFHYGWIVISITFLATLNSAGIRAVPAVLINPLEAEFGWTRTAIASAVAINLFLFGAVAPVGGWLVDRFGPKRVMLGALSILGIGLTATTMVSELWQFVLLWGVLVGVGAGSMSSVLSASVAHRWFVARRGLVLGILSSGSSTGQIIFLPLMMTVIVFAGWRSGSVVLVAITLTSILLIWSLMRDEPSEVGLQPYNPGGAAPAHDTRSTTHTGSSSGGVGILQAIKHPTFWLLCGVFFACGGTANGLIGTHLIPHTLDRGFPEVAAATTVGVMGGMNFVGTLLSGWLTDRTDARKLLAVVFAFRASALFLLPFVNDLKGLTLFAVIYGLDWFATVPPVIVLTGQTFGKESIGRIFGWIFMSHQIGGSLMALGAGAIYQFFGDYQMAFISGGVVGLIATGLAMGIKKQEKEPPLETEPAAA